MDRTIVWREERPSRTSAIRALGSPTRTASGKPARARGFVAKRSSGVAAPAIPSPSATVWVETDAACEVDVLGQRARTFHVEGHHYAVVAVTGLAPSSSVEYEVRLDGEVRRLAHGTVMPTNVRRGAPVGELRADPQQLGREHITPLADERPMPPKDVRPRSVALATKLAIRDAGARPDLQLKPLRIGIDTIDPDRRPLRARRSRSLTAVPNGGPCGRPAHGGGLPESACSGHGLGGGSKESAHAATPNKRVRGIGIARFGPRARSQCDKGIVRRRVCRTIGFARETSGARRHSYPCRARGLRRCGRPRLGIARLGTGQEYGRELSRLRCGWRCGIHSAVITTSGEMRCAPL